MNITYTNDPKKDIGFISANKSGSKFVVNIGEYSYPDYGNGASKCCNKSLGFYLDKEQLLELKKEIDQALNE